MAKRFGIDTVFHSFSLQKDPFLQQSPYYGTTWQELIQIPVAQPALITCDKTKYKLESGTSTAINSYVFV